MARDKRPSPDPDPGNPLDRATREVILDGGLPPVPPTPQD